ncbi:MAG: hypothetical protein V2B18_17260 [Pseudomonadota bacterium]
MKLVVSIDVEEEGLFSGQYPERDVPVENVPCLMKLDTLFRDQGIRPTLLISYQAAAKPRLGEFLAGLKELWGAEIGAHLHHWNTPPFEPSPYRQPVPSELMSEDLLTAKLDTLIGTLQRMGSEPISFRMGRFNMGPRMFSVLQRSSIKVDSSVAPMRREYGGPDHIPAPTDPYYPDAADIRRPGGSRILEVPITVLPLIPRLGGLLERLERRVGAREQTARFAQYVGSVAIQPTALGPARLRAASWEHQRRGGRLITLFFHSSELMPGGCREHATEHDVDRFLKKLGSYLSWLRGTLKAESITLSEVMEAAPAGSLPGRTLTGSAIL